MIKKPYKIYPSSAGFVLQYGAVVDYNSACFRYIVISKDTARKFIDPIYAKVGAFHEQWYCDTYPDEILKTEGVTRVDMSPTVQYSGRYDVLKKDGSLVELKGSLSKPFYREVIKKGLYKLSHIAQLVSYMFHTKIDTGEIVAGFYERDKETFKQVATRSFKIKLKEDGMIYVDDKKSGYTVLQQYAHTLMFKEVLETDEIKPRPINHIDFMGPCKFCPLKNLCDKYDKGAIDNETLKINGKELLNNIYKGK